MPIAAALGSLRQEFAQCDQLIANAHKTELSGAHFLSEVDRKQVIVAAFLNLFIAWETFVECSLAHFMAGAATLSGAVPTRYVCPPDDECARRIVVGTARYFDYANHENLKKVVRLYFENGYPFEPAVSSSTLVLADLRAMRNASAHLTSTTQAGLEAVAQRVLTVAVPGIELSDLLMRTHPGSSSGNTVFAEYRDILSAIAEVIANG